MEAPQGKLCQRVLQSKKSNVHHLLGVQARKHACGSGSSAPAQPAAVGVARRSHSAVKAVEQQSIKSEGAGLRAADSPQATGKKRADVHLPVPGRIFGRGGVMQGRLAATATSTAIPVGGSLGAGVDARARL
jgi:hypothetical protein